MAELVKEGADPFDLTNKFREIAAEAEREAEHEAEREAEREAEHEGTVLLSKLPTRLTQFEIGQKGVFGGGGYEIIDIYPEDGQYKFVLFDGKDEVVVNETILQNCKFC